MTLSEISQIHETKLESWLRGLSRDDGKSYCLTSTQYWLENMKSSGDELVTVVQQCECT